jgi:U3 small nucleolar RNA-associated protein 20
MQYLIEYPMGKNRLESHLKQMVLNIKYDYEDGRMSALDLINAVINKLPLPLLEECTQLLFLPLVLQMVNDDSKRCRERVGECLTVLLSRLSTTVLNSLYEYSLKWSADDSAGQLQRTSVQLFGLFLDARLDFMKKNNKIEKLVDYLRHQMDVEIGSIDHTNVLVAREWEMTYFCLQTIEKVGKAQKHILWRDTRLWEFIIQCLAHPHPWVKLVASRTIFTHLSTCELKQFQNVDDNSPSSIILKNPGSLFEITRNLCFELNSEEEHQSDDITTMAIKNLSWVIRVMHEYPALCFKDGERSELAADESGDDNEESTGDRRTAPVTWLIIRLSNIAKKVGYQRREAIFKCFAAFATVCDKSIICNHLELILEPLSRVITDAEAREERSSYKRGPAGATYAAADLPREVLQLLEDKCGTEVFINTLASVKSKAKEKREARKQKKAVEAVQDPESAAKRKIAKQQMEKQRKKRRVHERKVGRGVFTKKPRH